MSRPSDLWFRQSDGHWYTTLDGKQKRLDPDKTKARSKLQKLLRAKDGPADSGISFAELADQFLDHSKAENELPTYEGHKLFLQSFKDSLGGRRAVSRLCEADLDKWCRAQPTWNENTRARRKAIVLAALNFGVKKLNLPPHPLKHVRPGTVGRRERYLTPEEREKIRQAVKGPFAEYVMALEKTGARPFSEVCRVTAADVDLEKGTWTLSKWKNAKKKKGVKRVIYLPGRWSS